MVVVGDEREKKKKAGERKREQNEGFSTNEGGGEREKEFLIGLGFILFRFKKN